MSSVPASISYDHFNCSQLPSHLEWYRCFDDPGQRNWIDGREIHEAKSWDERAREKWDFFYRPIPEAVGRPQLARIARCNHLMHASKETLTMWRFITIFFGSMLALFTLAAAEFAVKATCASFIVVLLTILIGVEMFHRRRCSEQGRDIVDLREERKILLAQIRRPPTPEVMEAYLREEIEAMERKCMAEIIDARTDDPALFEKIDHKRNVQNLPFDIHGLLISSWGALQPMYSQDPSGIVPSGLDRVISKLGTAVGTWRRGANGEPMYRVLHLQYIFLLQRNINIYSFFYDFVTRCCFGRRIDVFQYNHVTNFSLRETTLDREISKRNPALPPVFHKQSLLDREVNSFSIATSSGSHITCVLADQAVVDSLNDWLNEDAVLSRMEASDREDVESRGSDGANAPAAGILGETSREQWSDGERQQVVDSLREARHPLAANLDADAARCALRQIRSKVEEYVQNIQPSEVGDLA